MKYSSVSLAVVVLIAGFVIGARFLGGEDTWLCGAGGWVKHGNPSALMPSEPCPAGSTMTPTGTMRPVSLYYYDPKRDTDALGNLLCSAQGLVTLSRNIPLTTTPIQDAVRELLKGQLTASERAQGITTEYPLPGLSLVAASLRGGVLTLTLSDPQGTTGGGSCRVGILRAQIEATAKQFGGVGEVRFMPEELFQP